MKSMWKNNEQWIIGLDPDVQDEYMVTFIVEYEVNGQPKIFRGIDILEYSIDDGERCEYDPSIGDYVDYIDYEAKGNGWWELAVLEKRFPDYKSIKVPAWMPLPEVCEED